ncbi:MAG: lipocalin [Polaromonas sp.]|nr:MAG: lipocalin [Polaromonas sp.]
MHLKTVFINALLAFYACSAMASDIPEPLASIPTLDVPRYMGTWYEIARYPNWFQRRCLKNTRADYSAQADGRVRVVNLCTNKEGEVIEAIGEARQRGGATSPKLEVRFAPAWLSFMPFVWGNYWVIDLDPSYQLVAVSEPKREYLWILSRTPEVTAKAYDELVARLEKKGLDSRKLERTPQGK